MTTTRLGIAFASSLLATAAACGDGAHPSQDAATPDAAVFAVTITDDSGASVTDLVFDPTPVGQSRTARLTVHDDAISPTGPIALAITGANADDFGFDNAATTCASGAAPGGSCVIALQFRPTAVGSREATLTLATAAGSATLAVHGTGFTPALHFVPSSVVFGRLEIGIPTSASIEIDNDDPAAAPLDAIVVTGAAFSVVSTTCGTTLAPHGSCSVVIAASPQALGDNGGTLSVTSDGSGYVATLDVRGAHRITVAKAGTGAGAVTSAPPGIDCGATCTGLFEGDVTLTAVPDASSQLTGWGFGGCAGATCVVPASTSATALTPSFALLAPGEVDVHFTGPGSGEVSVDGNVCSADCAVPMTPGVQVSVVVSVSTGAVQISGACGATGATCGFTQPAGTADVTVTIGQAPHERWSRMLAGYYSQLAYDDSGNLIVIGADITKLAPDGSKLWSIARGTWYSIATGPGDSIYVNSGDAIGKLDADGNLLWSIPLNIMNGCIDPWCWAVGSDGTFATLVNNTLTWWSADGSMTWTHTLHDGGGGITIDHHGVVSTTEFDEVETSNVIQLAADGSALPDPGIAAGGFFISLAATVDDHVIATSSHGTVCYLNAPGGSMHDCNLGGRPLMAAAHSGTTDLAWYVPQEPPSSNVLRVGSSPLELTYQDEDMISSVGIDSGGNLATLGTYFDGPTQWSIVQTFAP